MPIRIVVAGAAGRMGQALIQSISQSQDLELCGALEAPSHPDQGMDAGQLSGMKALGVSLSSDALAVIAKAEAIVDFTAPKVSLELADLAAQARITHVIGTTGFTAAEEQRLHAAARHAVIVKSGNMSLGVNLLAALVEQAAKALPDFDIEVVEMHHRHKVDAPSGTALLLGEAAAKGREIALADHAIRSRDGHTGARSARSIGFAALRGGTVVGDHDVILAGPQERIVLRHIAEDRNIFAQGALTAARWGQGKKPGFYSMKDVLGL